MFVLLCAPVLAANTTVFVTGQYYGNYTRLYDYTLSIYNSTGIVTQTGINSTQLNLIKASNSTASGSFVPVQFFQPNGSILTSTNINIPVNCLSTCEVYLQLYYSNGSTVNTEVESASGTSDLGFTTNVTLNVPLYQMIVWARASVAGTQNICSGSGDCNISFKTPGHVNVSLEPGTYLFYANDSRYAINSESRTIAGNYQNFTYTFYTTNSILFQFFDEVTLSLLNTTTTTAYVTSSIYSTNFTTSNGTRYVDLLQPTTYIITYSSTGYGQREYIYDLSNQSTTVLNLYLINDSDDTIVLATVFNTVGRRVESANIYLDKKNLSGTDYYTVETCTTNALGQCLLHVDLYDTTYQFRIEYNGEFVFNSNDTKVSSTAISFTIVTSTTGLGEIYSIGLFDGNISYSNSTKTFTYNFYDTDDVFSQVCMKTTIRRDTVTSLNATNCSTSQYGTITLSINTSVGDEWTGIAYGVLPNSETNQLDALSIVVSEFKTQFNRDGLFYFGFLLLGCMMFSALVHPIFPPIIAGVSMWVLNSLGFVSIGTSAVVSLFAIVIILLVVNRKS